MARLIFDVVGKGTRTVDVAHILNGGYAGRNTAEVQHHIDELALLGVPAPRAIPTLYPLSNYLASQADHVQVPHKRTSGEAEWALIIGDNENDLLVAAACDHTDRALEVHGVAWSKQSAPDFVGRLAWDYREVEQDFDAFTLKSWVSHGGHESLIQDGSPRLLHPPRYWVERLREKGLLKPNTMVMSGTIGMKAGIDQFAEGWRVELADGRGNISRVAYRVEIMPAAWE